MRKFIIIMALLVIACGQQAAIPTTTETQNAEPTTQPTDRPTPTTQPTPAYHHVICNAETVNLRSGAGTGYEAIADLSVGDAVVMLDAPVVDETMELWQKVQAGGLVGFIDPQYICEAK